MFSDVTNGTTIANANEDSLDFQDRSWSRSPSRHASVSRISKRENGHAQCEESLRGGGSRRTRARVDSSGALGPTTTATSGCPNPSELQTGHVGTSQKTGGRRLAHGPSHLRWLGLQSPGSDLSE